jgi:hypothetical protein
MDLEGKTIQQNDLIERLRCILEQEQRRPIHYDEASEVGETLLDFFALLADSQGD